MQASGKTLGPEIRDLDEQVTDHGLLQEAHSGPEVGTALDDGDMHRMGKAQELKACLPLPPILHRFLTASNREICDPWLH